MIQHPAWLASVHHDGSELYVSPAYPRLGETVRLRLRAAADAPVRRVLLRTFPDGEQFMAVMEKGACAPPVQWWEIDLTLREPTTHYRFVIEADDGLWWYNAAGPSLVLPLDAADFRILADYPAPAWLHEAVFYQIFPERFANGDPANDPAPGEWEYRGYRPQTLAWGALPSSDFPHSTTFYGGDLQGVQQHLDHLERLGVNAVYLNPVFTAHTPHKYDVVDYEHVDPHFGGDAALSALSAALHARGFHYILDIVPNHCGYMHSWFQTARADANAPEAEFFTFRRHPDEYESWLGVWLLPKLNYASAELRRRIYEGEGAVFRRWLRPPFNADGWRVDVGNMLGRQGHIQLQREVIQGIRRAVKETRPDAYLMAENFYDATPQLQGDQWDGVMNYQGLSTPLSYWLKGVQMWAFGVNAVVGSGALWPTEALAQMWAAVRAAMPWAVAAQQFNVVDSHDTQRIRTQLDGNTALQRLAAIVQFTYPGAPCIYYGDEIGMSDQPQVQQRACMEWDESRWDHELFAFYQQLIALRRRSAALQRGGFQMLAVEPDAFAFLRESARASVSERVLVVAQRSAQPRPAGPLPVAHGGVPDGARFVEYFTGQAAVVENGMLPLPELPQGASVWESR